MAESNGVQAVNFTLYPEQVNAIEDLAEYMREVPQPANSSAALRRMVNHFVACQFPLLGIERAGEAPQ